MVPLKYLSNFQRTLKILFINCEMNLIITWSENSVVVYTTVGYQGATFAIAESNFMFLYQIKIMENYYNN